MTGLRFADTNIVLYSIGKDSGKKAAARSILALRPVISAQVVNEA
jgi:predicted nucleic acid-binding protein